MNNIIELLEVINKNFDLIKCIFDSVWGINNIETVSNIFLNLVLAFGGIVGILYYKKVREKQKNAVFSYLTQLQVRVKSLSILYHDYENQIMERFLVESMRRNDIDSKSVFIDKIIKEFSDNANETLYFLEGSCEQMPASKEWSEQYEILIEFLLDAKHLSVNGFYKWNTDQGKEDSKQYASKHKNNLEKILKDISDKQKEIIQLIYKK